jgi:ketosteroid isomerase-like protein
LRTMTIKAIELVHKFWELMQTNDFRSVGTVLSDDFVLEWPQSKERIRGRDNYVRMNVEYPAHGQWHFTVNRVVGNEWEAVSDVSVTDGVQKARVISFFTVRDERIARMVEFWPDDFAVPGNRKHLVEPTDAAQ